MCKGKRGKKEMIFQGSGWKGREKREREMGKERVKKREIETGRKKCRRERK